ncbi:Atxe2 family lasso peptide isopeptidase [Allosphingosinicella deserti]|uniref:Peptidase n=1 Tax=Allosphingosinicella deserti TaxID=2116704 RepID=A0A2P7QW15_9SPHN|nr:Atxe2 family lasso peptide isopeptidase [Sphingomonas deserti]PSJ42171.1 peptidase [Sphingomonas deserti]
MVGARTARRARRCTLLILLSLIIGFGSASATPGCDDVLPPPAAGAIGPERDVTTDDLLRLRDVGQPDGAMFGQPTPFAVSPSGGEAAFIISRADPDRNLYCRALVAVGLAGAPARILDRGGEMIINSVVARNLVVANGFPTLLTPVWSPDGRWIAYQRRDQGITQVWRARADGSGAEQVTRSETDVEGLAWSANGKKIVYVTRPERARAARSIDEEGRNGWLYDARFAPEVAPRPLLPGTAAREAFTIDPETGAVVPAIEDERALVPMQDLSGQPIAPAALSASGRRAWTERRDPSPLSPLRLLATDAAGRTVTCRDPRCDGGFTGLWWDGEGREVRFLRREGWANGELGLYRWVPGSAPRRVLLTSDVLLGCTPAGVLLLCTSESAVVPRHLVLVDSANGRLKKVFDPNPEFGAIRLGKVERLRWRNHLGLEAWGDLVLPPDHRSGTRLPMIVVQYHSDGFLRGGTGDENPIHAFAARGFAVLSIERPVFVAARAAGVTSYDDVNAINAKDWAERRSLLSSLVTGVDRAIAAGIADPARIGITGLSDGASTARFALINTDMFAAASISSCCIEPNTVMTYGGIAYADAMRAMGYPPATTPAPDFWRPYSMALNAGRMDRPLLMQLADGEYLLALETFTALREAEQPVEMYVFPGEHHIKWQPAHRRAIYQRNLDWFAFWLQDRVDADPGKAAQYLRWARMRLGADRTASPP